MSISVCYVVMEPFAGTVGSILVGFFYVHSAKMVALGATMGGFQIWQIALMLHISAWTLQFIGHGVFEGNYSKQYILFHMMN
jgi:uncharacterized membrane protein YGL010W